MLAPNFSVFALLTRKPLHYIFIVCVYGKTNTEQFGSWNEKNGRTIESKSCIYVLVQENIEIRKYKNCIPDNMQT